MKYLITPAEVIVCEAAVEIDGTKGIAVAMGDDAEKTLDMAIIDAAVNKGIFTAHFHITKNIGRVQAKSGIRPRKPLLPPPRAGEAWPQSTFYLPK